MRKFIESPLVIISLIFAGMAAYVAIYAFPRWEGTALAQHVAASSKIQSKTVDTLDNLNKKIDTIQNDWEKKQLEKENRKLRRKLEKIEDKGRTGPR